MEQLLKMSSMTMMREMNYLYARLETTRNKNNYISSRLASDTSRVFMATAYKILLKTSGFSKKGCLPNFMAHAHCPAIDGMGAWGMAIKTYPARNF